MSAQYTSNTEFFDQAIPSDVFSGLSDDQITEALVWASSIADGYIRVRYTLPLAAPYDEALKANVADIAAYRLSKRRGFRPGSGNDEIIVDAYKDAIEWLTQLSAGKVRLGCLDATPDVDEEGSLAISEQLKNNWSINTGGRTDERADDSDPE